MEANARANIIIIIAIFFLFIYIIKRLVFNNVLCVLLTLFSIQKHSFEAQQNMYSTIDEK